MLVQTISFILLAFIIALAATYLAKYADRLAEQTGLGGSITGLVLLAGATSLPELSIGFSAVKMDAVDLTAGDVLGSSLMNLLILAILDLVIRKPTKIFSRTAAAHALAAIVACFLTGLVLLGILLDASWSILRLGPMSWCLLIAYAVCARLIYLDERTDHAKHSQAKIDVEINDKADKANGDDKHRPLWWNAVGFTVAAIVIFFVAPQLAYVADRLAEETGMGRTFFGTLFVAITTSLPEAVATFAAVRMGTTDMAIGNILGSNAMNVLILAVLDVGSKAPILSLVSDTHAITAACVIITTCATALSLLYRPEKRFWLIEPDAALIVLMVVASLWLVYISG